MLHVALNLVVVGFYEVAPSFALRFSSGVFQLSSPVCEPVANLLKSLCYFGIVNGFENEIYMIGIKKIINIATV